MLLLLLVALGLAEGVAATALPESISETTRLLFALCLAWPPVLLAVAWLRRAPFHETFGLRRVSWKPVALSALAAAGLSVGISAFLTWMPGPPPQSATEFHETLAPANRAALLLAMLIAGPLFEELFFRGWMLPAWVRRFGPAGGVIAVAALFALLHLAAWRFLVAFPLGLLLGWIALRCASTWPAIAGHAAANAGPFALDASLRIGGYSAAEIEAMDRVPLALPLLALAVCATALVLLALATRAAPAES